MGELPMDVRMKIEDLLKKNPVAMEPGEIGFLFGRREYLSKEQRADYGLDKMEKEQSKKKPEPAAPEAPTAPIEPAADPGAGSITVNNENEEGMIEHVVTQEDLDANPELLQRGVKVGETIMIPEAALDDEEDKQPPAAPVKAKAKPKAKPRAKSTPGKSNPKKRR